MVLYRGWYCFVLTSGKPVLHTEISLWHRDLMVLQSSLPPGIRISIAVIAVGEVQILDCSQTLPPGSWTDVNMTQNSSRPYISQTF